MSLYSFFVGSTERHNAHRDSHELFYVIPEEFSSAQYIYGVWNGDTENVARYTVELPNDATAQRVAYGLAALTGNDAVLVSRLTVAADEERSMGGTRAYRVTTETRSKGNRTVLGNPATRGFTDGPYGYAYVPDVKGSYVAFLVWQDASVTGVN